MSINNVSSSAFGSATPLTQGGTFAKKFDGGSNVNGTKDPSNTGAQQLQTSFMQALQSVNMPASEYMSKAGSSNSTPDANVVTQSSVSSEAEASDFKKNIDQLNSTQYQKNNIDGSAGFTSLSGVNSKQSNQNTVDLPALFSQTTGSLLPQSWQADISKSQSDYSQSKPTDTASSNEASPTSSSATLQTLLSQLQRNLGYGSAGGSVAQNEYF